MCPVRTVTYVSGRTARLAQLAERRSLKAKVRGSKPRAATNHVAACRARPGRSWAGLQNRRDGFNSRSRIQLAPVARMDRRPISTRVYAGSNPAWNTNRLRSSADERPRPKRDDAGSTPVAGSNDNPNLES